MNSTSKCNKKKIFPIIIILGFIVFCFIMWFAFVQNVFVSNEQIVESQSGGNFIAKNDYYDKISICNDLYEEKAFLDENKVTLSIDILDNEQNIVWSEHLNNISITSNNFYSEDNNGLMSIVELSSEIKLEKGEKYYIHFSSDSFDCSGLSIAFFGTQKSILVMYVFLCTLLLLFVLMGYCLSVTDKKKSFIAAFIIMSVIGGVVCNIFMIPLCVPDEYTHFGSAYNISSAILGEQQNDAFNTEIFESGIKRIGYRSDEIQSTYFFWSDWEYGNYQIDENCSTFPKMLQISRYVYIPQAIGIAIAKLFGMPYQLILLGGRISNLLFISLLASLAMLVNWKSRYVVASIFLLPSTLWLTASYSYDGWNLAFSILFVALCLKYSNKNRMISFTDFISIFIVYVMFAPVKMIYSVLILMILCVHFSSIRNKKSLLGAAITFCLSLFVLIVSRGKETIELLTTQAMDYRGNDGSQTSYTIGWVISNVNQTISVFANTLKDYSGTYIRRLFLGESYVEYIPDIFTALLIGLFILLVLLTNISVTKRTRFVSWITFIVCVVVVFVAFLFTYSTISDSGSGVIAGVQGRYFLPLLILLPSMIHSTRIVRLLERTIDERNVFSLLSFVGAIVIFLKFIGIVQCIPY